MNLDGTHVAMVTPFDSDKNIDEERYRSFIEYLIEEGVDGIVAAATTGESATLSHQEHKKVIDLLIDQVDGRVTTIAGAGSNSTSEALDLLKYSYDAGADSALVITPYYNKPQQSGLYEHYKILNDSCDMPMIVYNVPSRTSLNISIDNTIKLATLDNVVAIKEANPDLNRLAKIFSLLEDKDLSDDFKVLSGNDSLTLPMISQGARGVISVTANILPTKMARMVNEALEGNYDVARKLSNELFPLMDVLFIESSPAPAKKALELMGMPVGGLRMPLVDMDESNVEILKEVLKRYDL